MANRFSWKDIKSDYSAGESASIVANNMMADDMFGELTDVGQNFFDKRSATAESNAASSSASNTANIIEQIRAGKTPERSGLYDAGAISDAKYEYDKYQTAQGFKLRAENRAIANAARARASASRSTANALTAGSQRGGYTPYQSDQEKQALNTNYFPLASQDIFSQNALASLNNGRGVLGAPGNQEYSPAENAIPSGYNAEFSGGLPLERALEAQEDERARKEWQRKNSEVLSSQQPVQGDYSDSTPSPEEMAIIQNQPQYVRGEEDITKAEVLEDISRNQANSRIKAENAKAITRRDDIVNGVYDIADTANNAANITGNTNDALMNAKKDILESNFYKDNVEKDPQVGDKMMSLINKSMGSKTSKDFEKYDNDQKKREASAEAAKVLKAETQKKEENRKESDRIANLTDEERGKEIFNEWMKGDMKDKNVDNAIKKYFADRGIEVSDDSIKEINKHVQSASNAKVKQDKKTASAKTAKPTKATTEEQATKRDAETVRKYTKTRDDTLKKARDEKQNITKWAVAEKKKASNRYPTTPAGGRAYKAQEGQIERDKKQKIAEQEQKIKAAKEEFTTSAAAHTKDSVARKEARKAKLEKTKEANASAKQKLKEAKKTIADIKDASAKKKKKFNDFKRDQLTLNKNLTDKQILARFNGWKLDGSKDRVESKEKNNIPKKGKANTDAVLSTIQKLTGIKPSQLDKAPGSSGSYNKLNTFINLANDKYPTIKSSDIAAFLTSDYSKELTSNVLDTSDNWMPWSDSSMAINYKPTKILEMFEEYAKINNKASSGMSNTNEKTVDANGAAVAKLLKDGS